MTGENGLSIFFMFLFNCVVVINAVCCDAIYAVEVFKTTCVTACNPCRDICVRMSVSWILFTILTYLVWPLLVTGTLQQLAPITAEPFFTLTLSTPPVRGNRKCLEKSQDFLILLSSHVRTEGLLTYKASHLCTTDLRDEERVVKGTKPTNQSFNPGIYFGHEKNYGM